MQEETTENLDHLTIGDLKLRLGLANKIIKEAQAEGDKRWEKVVPQVRRLNAALAKKLKEQRKERGELEPEPVTVGMKALDLTGRAISGGSAKA